MQFCRYCEEITVMYVDGLREAFCTNKSCKVTRKFETYSDCVEELSKEEEVHRKKTGLKRVPWSKSLIRVETDPLVLNQMAKEMHEVFSVASITHGLVDEEEYALFEELPYNVKQALMELVMYVDKNYIRR